MMNKEKIGWMIPSKVFLPKELIKIDSFGIYLEDSRYREYYPVSKFRDDFATVNKARRIFTSPNLLINALKVMDMSKDENREWVKDLRSFLFKNYDSGGNKIVDTLIEIIDSSLSFNINRFNSISNRIKSEIEEVEELYLWQNTDV